LDFYKYAAPLALGILILIFNSRPSAQFASQHFNRGRFLRRLNIWASLQQLPNLRPSAVDFHFFPTWKKYFFAFAKNMSLSDDQNIPQTLIETPIFSQRFIKNKNRVKRAVG
jgi:hypothetical protein